ncbi:ACT domain-containing protein ACR4-like [Bidens hawaiensis]|uniref:ACT domain-containing protein ACR4-like n=1 Tax=Bidens hawaiensis TaxID=980011 RepID=UPI00404A3F98
MIIVYEHMANGTLADHIYKKTGGSSVLSWERRLKICIGVGRGLEYLHTGTGINQIIIHRDIKSSNILLDENLEPRISDFGLCKKCIGNQAGTPIIASVKGTKGYMDPHYYKTRELSTKTDVYAFGVVLLEVFCGRRSSDFVVQGRPKRFVPWARQCIRERVSHRIMDRGLSGKISNDGLLIFEEITLQCLQERPDKRPIMEAVVARLEDALKSQYTTYSSSPDEGDEFIRIYFGQVDKSSSYSTSDADSLRRAVETGSSKSDSTKHDPDSESNTTTTTTVRRHRRSKSSINLNGLDVSSDINNISETSNGISELDKLARRINPPNVVFDNDSSENATVIEVNGTGTLGVLLELLQVLTDYDLKVIQYSRTNDGSWFMDVFHVIDHEGKKVTDEVKKQNIQKALEVYSSATSPMGRKCNDRPIPSGHTTLELIGNDRPGLISELTAIIGDLQCNVVTAEIWTHNGRLAAVMHVSDKQTKSSIIKPEKLLQIKNILRIVLQGGHDNKEPMILDSNGCTWIDRKLHQIMFADQYYEPEPTLNDKRRHKLDVDSWNDNSNYSTISILCKHTPKVLFDTICTLTDLGYSVFHGKFNADAAETYKMDLWIRHIDGSTFKSDEERQKVIQYLEAAIERRVSAGLKIEIRTKDRVGLLSDVTRIMRENSLNITRAEVSTTGDKAVFSFYLDDNLGYPVDRKIIDYVKKEIGQNILQVKGNRRGSYQVVEESSTRFAFKDVLKAFIGWLRFSEHQVSFVSD